MAKPYDLYVRFLITLGCDELRQVNDHLADLSLHPVDETLFNAQFNLVHDLIPDPVARQIERKAYEGDFLRWMKALEVSELWQLEKPYRNAENAHLKLVKDIHYDPQLRLCLNALLIKRVKSLDIIQTLNNKFSYMLKVEHVDLYQKYFWNPARMTRADWRRYLEPCDEREKALLFMALTESLETVKTYLDLPSQANVAETLQFLFTNAYVKAKHYLRLNTKDANVEARAWISQTMMLADKYEKHRTGDIEDFGKTLQLEFDYLDTEFPTPDEATISELRTKQLAQEAATSAAVRGGEETLNEG